MKSATRVALLFISSSADTVLLALAVVDYLRSVSLFGSFEKTVYFPLVFYSSLLHWSNLIFSNSKRLKAAPTTLFCYRRPESGLHMRSDME